MTSGRDTDDAGRGQPVPASSCVDPVEPTARTELERMTGETRVYRIPVWDYAEGTGSNVTYHIVGFALFKLTAYDLGGIPKTISGVFHGWANDACPGNAH